MQPLESFVMLQKAIEPIGKRRDGITRPTSRSCPSSVSLSGSNDQLDVGDADIVELSR